MNARVKLVTLAIVAVFSGFAIAGCGVSEPKEESSATAVDTPTPEYLSPEDIAEAPNDSPEKTLLEFWSAIQNQQMPNAFDKLAPEYKDKAKNVDNFAKFIMADYAHWLINPEIISSNVSGNDATVGITRETSDDLSERSSVVLRRINGDWRIAYNFYLSNRLAGN